MAPLAGATLDDRDDRAARAEGGELRRRRALRRHGSNDVRARSPRSFAELSASPRRWSGSCASPTTSSSVGVDSGIRHAVSGADYGTVRAAAFMGYRMIAAAAGMAARPPSPGASSIDDRLFKGYLANVPAARLARPLSARRSPSSFGKRISRALSGGPPTPPRDRSGTHLSGPRRDRARHRGAPARHEFRALLATPVSDVEQRRVRLGELMYARTASYSACGPGLRRYRPLVALVREAGLAPGSTARRSPAAAVAGPLRFWRRAALAPSSTPSPPSTRRRPDVRRRSSPDRPPGLAPSAPASSFGATSETSGVPERPRVPERQHDRLQRSIKSPETRLLIDSHRGYSAMRTRSIWTTSLSHHPRTLLRKLHRQVERWFRRRTPPAAAWRSSVVGDAARCACGPGGKGALRHLCR